MQEFGSTPLSEVILFDNMPEFYLKIVKENYRKKVTKSEKLLS